MTIYPTWLLVIIALGIAVPLLYIIEKWSQRKIKLLEEELVEITKREHIAVAKFSHDMERAVLLRHEDNVNQSWIVC